MTPILSKQLTLWCGATVLVGALWWQSGALDAQGTARGPANSPLSAFLRARDGARQRTCQTNLRQIALALASYQQDYDERIALAKPWIDAVQPYIRSEWQFNCPAIPVGKQFGYAFNSRLSGKTAKSVARPAQTVLVYETTIFKRNAFGMGENIAFRHQNGANYAFVDGHVQWFPKTTIPSFKLKP